MHLSGSSCHAVAIEYVIDYPQCKEEIFTVGVGEVIERKGWNRSLPDILLVEVSSSIFLIITHDLFPETPRPFVSSFVVDFCSSTRGFKVFLATSVSSLKTRALYWNPDSLSGTDQ